jgi:hypothetical protein
VVRRPVHNDGVMDPVRLTIEQLRELRDDVAPEAVRRSRASLQRRIDRLRDRGFFIAQCALASGVAWALARYVVGHPMPFFAPVAAMICLGFSFGQRLRRVAELMVGVAIGVGVGDLFVHAFGTGVAQVVLVVALAMTLAVLLGAGTLMTTQYPQLLERLAEGTRLIAESLFEPAAEPAAHRMLGEVGHRTAVLPIPSALSAVMVLGQIRSTIVDLLELTGASYDEARELVPLRADGLDEK